MGQTLIPKFIANTLRTLHSVVSFPAVLIGLSLLLAFLSISPVSAAVVNQQMWDGSGPERIVVIESQR